MIHTLLRHKLGTDGIIEVGEVETFIQKLADTPPICSCSIGDSTVHSHPKPVV